MRNLPFKAFCYFALSAAITLVYVMPIPDYLDTDKLVLSFSIAGAKWLIQIIAALIFANKEIRWKLIAGMGSVAFIGSCVLLPYAILATLKIGGNPVKSSYPYFLYACVPVMTVFYYKMIRQINAGMKWFWLWILCLAIAVSLQLTLVFHVI